MAQAFNLTAQLNLRGPNNVGKIVSQIKKQLGTINANVNIAINPAAIQTVTQLNSALTTLNTTLATTSANATTTAAAVNSLMQAMNAAANSNINQSLNNASNAVQQLGANANAAAGGGAGGGGGVTQLRTEMEEFGRQSALAVRRFAAFSLVTSTVFALTNAFNQAFKAFIDFDKEFVKLQQVTGESAARLQNLAGTITELSTSLGVSSSQLAVVSSTLAQAGLSAKDTERALKALALSSLAPSFDDMNQTVEGSIALMRQFGISADQLGAALGSVNAVSAQFAVESSDIIAAIQRTGGVFASASKGVSEGTQALNEFIAVFTSVRATTRESAETIATGLRTIFTRIQRGSTIEALKEFGVTLTDAEGKFVGAYKAVELLSRGLNSIDPRDLKFSQIIEELGGFRQIGKVIPLIQQFGTAQQALAIAQGGQTSLTEDAIVAQLSLANQFAKVREEFVAMVREIGGTDTFQTLAKGALQLASALIQIADSVKGVLPVLAVITAVRGAGALRQFGRGFVGGMRGGQQNAAAGGMIRKYAIGGQVPVALMPGETVVYPDMVNRIGVPKLRQLNHADKKMARGGGVGLVPGKGRTDSFKTTLPVGSFVIRTDATKALGGPVGVMKEARYQGGGYVQRFRKGTQNKLQKRTQRTHFGPKTPLSPEEAKLAESMGTGSLRVVAGKTERQINFQPNIDSLINQRLRRGTQKTGVPKTDLLKDISQRSAIELFEAKGIPATIFKQLVASKKLDGLKDALLKGVKSKKVPALLKSDSELDFILKDFIKPYLGKVKTSAGSLWDELVQYQALTNPREVGGRTTLPTVKKSLSKTLGETLAFGGLIQKFGKGSFKPLESMGKSDLLKEALDSGLLERVPTGFRESIDKRSKSFDQVIYDKLLKDLGEKRGSAEVSATRTSKRAKKRNIAVVGLGGEKSSTELTTPGIEANLKKGTRAFPGVPATLQTGSLPPDVAKKVQAIIRNQSERIASVVGKLIAGKAGSTPVTDKKQIRAIVGKQLDNLSGLLFESGLAVAGAPYDPASKAIDFSKGLGDKLGTMFGVDPKALTDATNQATKEVAKTKVAKGQFDRGRKAALVSKRQQKRNFGGFIQRFAKGSSTPVRNLGYIDGDVLNDPANAEIVRKEMERLGITDIHKYKSHLSTMSAARRKSGDLSRLSTIYGVAGSGKSTFVQGGARAAEADNAKLRKTNRYPILTEEDVLRSSQIIDSTSVAGPNQKEVLSQSDRIVNLSSRTKESQEVLKGNRKSRDLTGKGLFGRKPGATKDASLDSGPGEAYIAASEVSGVNPKKVATYAIGPNFSKKRTSQPKVRSPEKTGLFYGNFGPTTSGHLSVVEEAKKRGIKPEDFVALVSGDTPIDYASADEHSKRTAIFPQTSKTGPSRLGMARATFGAVGANVAAMPKGSGPGSIPSAFKVGDDSYIVPRGQKDIAFAGDEKGEGSLNQYTKSGYSVESLPRTGGISGTDARNAIMNNDMVAMKKLLSPEGMSYVQQHLETIQKRPGILDSILQRFQENSQSGKGSAGRLSSVKEQLSKLPARKSKTTPPEVVEQMESLRKERDKLTSKVGRRPARMLSRLESRRPKAVGGIIQRFGRGGLSNRLGVFDFDMTTGEGAQQETPSLSGFKNPDLAVPDILGAKPTGVIKLMKQYGASRLLTARSGGPKGEMTTALGSFFKKNGVYLPSNRIETLGDQVNNLSTAEKKARSLYDLVKKYGGVDFFDDHPDNINAAKMVRGVDARRVKLRKAAGGEIPIIAQEGEYVVNRKSAQSFGYDNLAKINKYHSGGRVGRVQKFASGGQPKLDTLGATATGLSPRAFQIFEKTLFKVSDLFNGMGARTLKTTQAMDMIAAVSPQLAADIQYNGMVHKRTATAQESVAVRYATLMQQLQKTNLTQQQLDKITAAYSNTIQADTNAKNLSIMQTKSLGSKIASAWNKASGIVSQAASSFAATLGKKTSTATPSPATNPQPSGISPAQQVAQFQSQGIQGAALKQAMQNAGYGKGGVNNPIAQQAISQVQGMSAQAQQAQTQRPSMMGRIGQGVRGIMGGQASMSMGFALPMLASSLTSEEPVSAEQAKSNATLGGVATGAGIGASLGGLPGALIGAVGGLITGIDAGAKAARQFAINIARNKIEDSGEKLAKTFEEINKQSSATPAQLASLNTALKASINAALESGTQALPKASLSQLLTEVGVAALGGGQTSTKENVDTRAAIFEQKGFMGLIKAMRGGQDVENSMYRDIAPTLARETSKGYAVAASQAKSVFEQQFKQGQSIEDLMNGPEWNKQAEVLARSNAAIQEQILLIQNLSGVSETEKKARIDSIIATEAEGQARKQFSEVKIAEDLKKLQKDINNLSFSFNRMLGNMDAAVQSSVANLAKLDESLSLSSASLSGGAKVGGSSSGVQNTLDVLKNPQGYSESQKNTAFSRAASPFGSQAGNIEKVLKAGSGLESTILGTINKTLSGTPKGETQEAVTAKIESAIRGQLKDLQLPPSLADKLSKQIGQSVGKLRQDGEDTVDYSQLIESVPELSKTIDLFKNTADQASKAMEFNKQAFDRLSEATNQQIDLTVESNARTRNAQNILAKGSMDLNKALGMNVSLGARRSAIESPIRSMTGGTTDPSAIGMNYNRLEAQRQQLQTGRNQAAASGDVGAVRAFDNQLAQTNTSLRENIDALKGMADSSELASAALDEIDKAQKRQQAGVGFMEKLVTSTPKELANMNQAFARLDANMKGIAVGGTNPEQRKQSLEMFQMIAPFLGDQEKGLQANVLQSMLQESGVGISPMLQQVLDGMRNPTADPQQALAIQTYQEATQKQAEANLQLATMNTNLANDISTKTGNAVAAAIQSNNIKFEQKQLDDLISRINIVPTDVVPAVGKADGGLIYKAVGGSIFKPKGTDTVPAMLTPGEFVVNRSATQANLPLLKSINNGYSKGGKVKYLAGGGYVSSNILKKDVDVLNPSLNTDQDISNDNLPIYNPELFPTTDAKKFSKLSGFISSTTRSWSYAGIVNGLSTYLNELKKSGGSSDYWGGQEIRSAADVNDYNTKIIANGGPDMSKFPIDFMTGSTEEFGYAPSFQLETKRSGFGNRWMLPSISSLKDSGNATAAGKLEKSIKAQTLVSNIPFDAEILNKIISNSISTIIGSAKLRKGKSAADITKYSEKKLLDINESSDYGYVGNQLDILDAARSASSIAKVFEPIDIIKNKLQDKPSSLGSAVLGISDVAKLYQMSAGGGFRFDPNAIDPDKYMGGVFVSPNKKESTVIGSNFKGNVLAGAAGAGSGGGSNGVGFSENSMAVGLPTEATIGSKLLNTQMLDVLKTKATEYETAVNTAYSELDTYIKNPDNFNSTSTQTQKASNISGLLRRIYDSNWPGLYIKLPTDNLNDEWKSKGTNGLAIFKPDLASIWEAKIALALTTPNKDLYKKAKGYKLNGEPSLVKIGNQSQETIEAAGEEYLDGVKSFPWIGDIKLAEEFSNNILRLEQEASQKSFVSAFKVDEQPIPEKVTLDKITLDKLGPGFSKDTKAEFGFQYRNIEVPKLSRNTGYAPPQNGEILKGIIVSAGGALDTSVLNPFLGEDITAGKGNIFANSLDEIKQKLIDTYTKYFEGDQAAFTSFSLATLATPQTWMTDLEKLNAYTTEDGLITNPWFPKISADAYKNQLLTSPGSGGQATTIPGATISIGDKLKTAQQLINQIIGPKIGVIRAFGYGLSPLSVPAQIGQYAEGLISLSKSFGSKIVGQNGSVNPNLADVWGRITAVGETFKFLAKDDLLGLSNKIGLGQSAMGVPDTGAISSQVAQYAQFLATQGTFLAGVSGQAQQTLEKQVTGDQQIASTSLSGGKSQSISDIFKGASDTTVAKDGKIQSKEATPPKTLLDLGKKVFNPYNSFANPNDRASLIDYLMSQIKDQVNPYFKSGVTILRNYLLGMDTLISGATVNEQDLDVNYKGANSALLALTNGEFGALPNVQKIKELAAFRAAQQQAKKDKAKQEAQNPGQVAAMATGGVVYASNGTLVNYQPRGTDTVPAMLTPGEFVVNRSATQKNLPLLHAINSGGTQGLNRGGIVNYLQSGGIILPQYHADGAVASSTNSVVGGGSIKVDGSSAARGLESALTVGTNALKQVLQGFGISPESITAINSFVTGLQKVSEVLANINITPEVKFTGSVDVNVRGAEGLTGPMRDLVNGAINNAMTRLQSANSGAKLEVPQGDFTSGK